MLIPGYRKGRVGIVATLMVMFSMVLFIGSLFWLTTNGPWGGGSLFGDDLFKPVSMSSEKEPENQSISVTKMNITEAMEDLTNSGCVFTEYTKSYSEAETIKLDYQQFKNEAVDRKIVFSAKNTSERTVLLVVKNGHIYEWSP
jgi:hypothetical protein